MSNNVKAITEYFRNAVASQANMGIDFKQDFYSIIRPDEVLRGRINEETCAEFFAEVNKPHQKDKMSREKYKMSRQEEQKKKTVVNVIICAKTIKTMFEENAKLHEDIEELTGIYFIPAILTDRGLLSFDGANKKLPWFPRAYLLPMVEPKLAVGTAEAVDFFMSSHVDEIEKMESWFDYTALFKEFYQAVTGSSFDQSTVSNIDKEDSVFELENNMFLFLDQTVFATHHIMSLYNHLLEENVTGGLYQNFLSTEFPEVSALAENDLPGMQAHCGQMNGEYPLSPSQREAVNHFKQMEPGEILAVNGPPGTGKTTLLQTIVADMYVERAIKQDKPPLIVASSTNNQAVTNIISSFGNIKKTGLSNLEERWIEGADSFACYFPSSNKEEEARRKGFQYTNSWKQYFVDELENEENINQSKSKLIESCSRYFHSEFNTLTDCQEKLHEELLFFEQSKAALLSLVREASECGLTGEPLDRFIEKLITAIEELQKKKETIQQRIAEWEECYKKIPCYVKWLKFIKWFARKIQTEFRLFMDDEEQSFLSEEMSFDEIKEAYSLKYEECNQEISEIKQRKAAAEDIKRRYDDELELLRQHNVRFFEKEEEAYRLELEAVNDEIDKKHRYIEFWLAVHYYECRWCGGEDELSEKQKTTNHENVMKKFYHRLCMVTPCLVMTFYMLPKQFMAYNGEKSVYLYRSIDLLIVDEAGQVSPEIAAGAFSLAKKALVVGDVYQIEPVWGVTKAMDQALALAYGAISSLKEYERLEQTGLNASSSSVMKVAAKCCRYAKFDEKGLFLCEHRRCYDEIIDYCNQLVYKGHLCPMRGRGKDDQKRAMKQWPQMGYKQIDTEHSTREGNSRGNRFEAEQISLWLKNQFELIMNAYPEEAPENLVGVITPFRAQAAFIRSALKRNLPEHWSDISVGTVHTFQGAERKMIILSTVYGKLDGCFFIDANKSLMNVAVSRAKDHFFVFGDIACLKDTTGSASGLLKKFVAEAQIE